jgi:hypothetical protein
MPNEIAQFIPRLLQCCLDMRFVWLLGQDELAVRNCVPRWELLAFADALTLERLRKADALHREDIDVMVVTDGDAFHNAWGRRRLSGSLVRWSWQQSSSEEAFYSEARWAGPGNEGNVVRVRRRAVLVWSRAPERPSMDNARRRRDRVQAMV